MALLDVLAQNELFAGFGEDELVSLCVQSERREFRPGETIIEAGETGQFLGVLVEGEAEVCQPTESGEREVVAELASGAYFGEMSLISGEPTNADVVACSACRVLLVPLEVFRSMLATRPAVLQHIARTITLRLRDTLPQPEREHRPATAEAAADERRSARILVVECGSSTIEYSFLDAENEASNLRGTVAGLGTDRASHTTIALRTKTVTEAPAKRAPALEAVLARLTEGPAAPLADLGDLAAIGHRVAHGGEAFSQSAVVDQDVLERARAALPTAPPGSEANLLGLRELCELAPDVPHIAVFDTAFFQRMPPRAFLYGLPRAMYEEHRLRRYGCGGIRHSQAALLAAAHLDRPLEGLKMVTCLVAKDVSVCAIEGGRPIDVSCGLTTLEGPPGVRSSGDVDPGLILHLADKIGLSWPEIGAMLRSGGGVTGLAEVDGDFGDVIAAAEARDQRARHALGVFCYRLKKYIGAYAAALGGLDVLVFTGEVVQEHSAVWAEVCEGLEWLGLRLGKERAEQLLAGAVGPTEVSDPTSPVRVLVAPTDEHRMIASEAVRALGWESMAAAIRAERRPIPIATSAHHLHLSQEHVEALYGPGHELTFRAQLSQPGQYACEETVTLIGPRGPVGRVRVLGPAREQTQVEISRTEQRQLGIEAPTRHSGNVEGSPGITLEGAAGQVELEQGVISAGRHVHMSPEDALRFGVRDKDVIEVRVAGDTRSLVFGDVLVRVHPDFRLDMHVDTDEANAAELERDAVGYMVAAERRA